MKPVRTLTIGIDPGTGLNAVPVAKPQRFQTFAGTIEEGMDVIGADGESLGRVSQVKGDQIILAPADDSLGVAYFLPLSLIDGIHGSRILLAGRGDGSFGLGAQP